MSAFGSQFGDLHMTGWIADAPTGTEEAFLLITTDGGPAASPQQVMPVVADLLGLPDKPGVDMQPAGPAPVRVQDGWVTVDAPGCKLERPVSGEWAAVVQQRGRVVLVVGFEPFPAGMDPDEYTSRYGGWCSLGLVPATVTGQE